MKITFLIPPKDEKGRNPERLFGCNFGLYAQQNIFILYSASTLEQKGHEVVVKDCPVNNINWSKFKNWLTKDNSDVYVFYTPFLAEEVDKKAHKLIREIFPNRKIIFSGPECSSRPEAFLLDINTFVIRGEPENVFEQLFNDDLKILNNDLDDVQGLSYRCEIINEDLREGKPYGAGITILKGDIHTNPSRLIKNLDELPFPARHLLDKEKYFNPKLPRPSTVLLTSRGCFGQCIYCIPCSLSFANEIEFKKTHKFKPPVRMRSPENIYEEVKQIKKMGYKSFYIIDDNFTTLKGKKYEDRIIKICNLIKPLNLIWGCLARADQIKNEEMIKAMADAGCKYVDLGIESFNQKTLDFVKKGCKVEDNYTAILLLKKYKINPKINVLLGVSPFETKEDIHWMVEVLKILDIEFASFDIVIPHPRTEIYDIAKKNEWFATEHNDYKPVDPLKEGTLNLPNLSKQKLEELVRWANREFYLRPSYIWLRLKKIRSFQELKDLFSIALKLFR